MKALKEIVVIFLLSVPPIVLAYLHGGAELLLDVIKGMLAHSWILYYTMAGTFAFAVIAFLDWHLLFHNPKIERMHNFLSDVFYEMASSLLSLLRISGGVLIGAPVLWIIFDFNYQQLQHVGYLLLMGCLAVVECILIEQWLRYVKARWLRASA